MRAPKQLAVILAIGLHPSVQATVGAASDGPPITVGTRDPDALYAKWRYIGVMNAKRRRCPEPTSSLWTTEPLFAVDPPPGDGAPPPWSVPGIPALYQFCAYETAQRNPERPEFADESALIRLGRDFMGLMPAGGAIDGAYAIPLTSHFASQAGDVDLPIVPGNQRVRLAILDTAATREYDAEDHHGTSDHGFTLLNLAKGLLCDSAGNCVAKVTSRLAMGWKCFDGDGLESTCRDVVHGGLYGLGSEMARAINLEVQQWQAVDPDKKLVANFSMGWDPELGGLEPVSSMPAAALAIYTAMQHLVCEGAVAVAAAGNRTGGPTEEVGPILPAAWEQRGAPTQPYCRAIGATPDSADFPGLGPAAYRPLVHAVGGVRAGDGPLFNSRIAGEPRLVAFGDHAKGKAPGAPGNGYTDTITGTSASAVIAASAAAAAWYYKNGLKPYDVLDTVYAGGTPVGRTAAFCLGGAPCPGVAVMRVSVCDSADQAGAVLSSPCPDPEPLAAANLSLVKFKHAVTAAAIKLPYPQTSTCHWEQLWYEVDPPADPCPHWQYYPPAPRPSTETQPGPSSNICPTCDLQMDSATLSIEIGSDVTVTVEGGILICGQETYNLNLPPMGAGETAQVTDVTCPLASDPVQLSFTVDSNSSVTSPVLVVGPQTP